MSPWNRARARARAAAALALAAAPSLLAAACPRAGPGAERAVAVLVSADLRGYLAPCGCTEHMLGGVDRAAAQVAAARAEVGAAVFADAGDSLFPAPDLAAEQVTQAERKTRALADAFVRIGVAAVAVGHRDLARGAAFTAALGLPLLGAGVGPESAPQFRVAQARTVRVGFAAGSDGTSLAAAAGSARAAGAEVVVGLFHGTVAAAARIADDAARAGADLVVAGHVEAEADGEKSRSITAAIPVVAPASKGRALVRADFVLRRGTPRGFRLLASDDERRLEAETLADRIDRELATVRDPSTSADLKALRGKKVVELQARRERLLAVRPPAPADASHVAVRFIDLSDDKPSDPAVKALVHAYDRDVALLNLAWAKEHAKDCPAPAPKQAAFVGTAACLECHAEAKVVWDRTGHAHAYRTLEERNKHYDLDCLRCHVTGYGAPGGVCRVDKAAGRTDVQCESCHGPGSVHSGDPTAENVLAKPGEVTCIGCHNPENSPNFSTARYLPRVLGPGHGQPLPKAK